MKKILVVEDDEFICDSIQNGLSSSDITVSLAKDGNDAIKYFALEKPELVVLDLLLPKKGGMEVLKFIKSQTGLKDIPIIIASNLDQPETIKQSLELGANEYVVKSNLNISDLLLLCKKYLK